MNEAQDRPRFNQINLMAALVVAITSVFCLLILIPSQVSSVASPGDLSPSFTPKLAAWILLVLSIALATQATLKSSVDAITSAGKQIVTEGVICVAMTGIILVTFHALGFIYMAVPLMIAVTYFAGGRRLYVIAAISVILPIVLYYGTWQVFTVQLP